jgi:hypothetical protein
MTLSIDDHAVGAYAGDTCTLSTSNPGDIIVVLGYYGNGTVSMSDTAGLTRHTILNTQLGRYCGLIAWAYSPSKLTSAGHDKPCDVFHRYFRRSAATGCLHVQITPNQACYSSVTGKTNSGVNVVLTPTLSSVTLAAGQFDVLVHGSETTWTTTRAFSPLTPTT